MPRHDDSHWMRAALTQAKDAADNGEVPVGAVVVKDGAIVGIGRNSMVGSNDPCAHAEINALRAAAATLKNYRLDGCELYVTLEPCAMCAGAILHARLKRVAFGAPDPKTGAAGSVINLFAQKQLNYHTQVSAGVLAEECGQTLQSFFQAVRQDQKQSANPLREDALRTPDGRFGYLPGYPWQPHYISNLEALRGLRMHYLDEGAKNAPLTFLCLHGNPGWSYLYRKMLPIWTEAGHRVIAPDMIGFGKSDKPKRAEFHTFSFHRAVLQQLVEHLDLHNIVLVVQDWGGILGLTLPMDAAQRYHGLLVMNTTLATGDAPLTAGFLAWREMCRKNPSFDVPRLFSRGNPQMTPAECGAFGAPFPDAGHRAAVRAFTDMVPDSAQSPGADISRQAQAFLSEEWKGRSMMVIGCQDPVLGRAVMQVLRTRIHNCPIAIELENAGHFVQEVGEPIARTALEVFAV